MRTGYALGLPRAELVQDTFHTEPRIVHVVEEAPLVSDGRQLAEPGPGTHARAATFRERTEYFGCYVLYVFKIYIRVIYIAESGPSYILYSRVNFVHQLYIEVPSYIYHRLYMDRISYHVPTLTMKPYPHMYRALSPHTCWILHACFLARAG